MSIKKLSKSALWFIQSTGYFGIYFIKFVLRGSLRKPVKTLRRERDMCILANGPSTAMEIERLRKHGVERDLMVVNFFASSDDFLWLQPAYYVLSDAAFFMHDKALGYEKIQKLYARLNEKVTWRMILFVPYASRKTMDWAKLFTNGNVQVAYFNDIPYCGVFASRRIRNFLYDRGWAMPRIGTVVQPCIYLSVLMGYKTIRLFGVEHDWLYSMVVNDKNEVCLLDRHFYDGNEKSVYVPWISPYAKEKVPDPLCVRLQGLATLFESHMVLNDYARHMRCRIVNHTPDSYIDAYERDGVQTKS